MHPLNGDEMELTKSNTEQLIENGRQTRFGIDWPGQRCLAKTRAVADVSAQR